MARPLQERAGVRHWGMKAAPGQLWHLCEEPLSLLLSTQCFTHSWSSLASCHLPAGTLASPQVPLANNRNHPPACIQEKVLENSLWLKTANCLTCWYSAGCFMYITSIKSQNSPYLFIHLSNIHSVSRHWVLGHKINHIYMQIEKLREVKWLVEPGTKWQTAKIQKVCHKLLKWYKVIKLSKQLW